MTTWLLAVVMWASPVALRPCPEVARICDGVFDWTRCACLGGRVAVSYARGVRVAPVAEGHAVWVSPRLVVVVTDELLGDILRAVSEGATATDLSAAGWTLQIAREPPGR